VVEYYDLEGWNPWWERESEILEEVKHLKKRERWLGVLKKDLSQNVVLVGPRRAGKTSLMKMVMAELEREGKDMKKILYLPCDTIKNYKELKEYLELFFRINKGKYVFLDEIQFVDEWYRTVKMYMDQSKTFFITGSSSLIVDKAAVSYLVDRHTKKTLLPMKFSEIMETKEGLSTVDLRTSFRKFPSSFLSPKNLFRTFERFSSREIKAINFHFEKYLIEGGFPKTIFKHYRAEFYQQILGEVFSKDLAGERTNKTWQDFLLFLEYLAQSEGVGTNINAISRRTEMDYKTVKSFIHWLERLFILVTVPNCSRSMHKERSIKRQKIYFQDRGLKTALIKKFSTRASQQRKGEDLSRDAEAIIVENMLRTPELNICYFQESPTSKEIDAVIRVGERNIMVEIEWGGNYSLKNINEKMKKSKSKDTIILTRDERELVNENIVKLPASLFTLLF